MGGRGTYAAGKQVDFVYETDMHYSFAPDGKLYDVKIIKGKDGTGKHGLPESSHLSVAYLKLNPDGTFHEMRIYDKNHCLRMEIAYHNEPRLGKGKILHYHMYDERFSKNSTGEFSRSRAVRITKSMSLYKEYKKYFRGVTL